MRILDRLLNKDRIHWFVCYSCMTQTGHEPTKSVFYSEQAPVIILGRAWQQCPRYLGTNTKSFQELKKEGSENALFGLERIVRKYPRDHFQVSSPKAKGQSG